jgi:TonB-dependent SusC/RagA subfamily outer membrane receptor
MKTAKHFVVFLFCIAILCITADTSAQAKANTLPPGTYKTIFEMLKDVPGLEVNTNGDKSGGTIVIRGVGSLRNQKNPLIVVDGAIYGGDISTINPQDVDGISVLKDAASATAYGAQGAAGVIIITTKRGVTAPKVPVATHDGSAYSYFIEHKTMLKVIGFEDELIVQGVPQKQKDNALVFIVKKKELLVPIINIKKVEMVQQ